MKKFLYTLWVIPLSFISLTCEDFVLLNTIDGESCVLRENGQIIIGDEAVKLTCFLGETKYERDEETGEIILRCLDSSLPQEEICDFIDNDCNGISDDIFFGPLEPKNLCQLNEYGVCKLSTYQCVEGKMICIPPVDLYGQETCDLLYLDEDCDSLINEEDPSMIFNGEDEWEYWGPDGTINIGECRSGHRECRQGEEILFGMVLPIEEICGNDDDDNCDGVTDESNQILFEATDFLISIDGSGSMGYSREVINNTLCDWSVQNRFTSSRFAIVVFGVYNNLKDMEVVTDFTNAQTACTMLDAYLNTISSGAVELQPDSIIDTFIDGNMLLSWSQQNKRRAILFTDESLQSDYFFPFKVITNSCSMNNYSVSVFLDYNTPDYSIWQLITQHCSGFLEEIDLNNELTMREKLNYYFGSDTC